MIISECFTGGTMALPLLWLGAAALSAFAVRDVATERTLQQQKRREYAAPQRYDALESPQSAIASTPSDVFFTKQQVKPEFGAIVCCGIAGILEHTGIWIGEDTIIELDGNGLIKPVSSSRFIGERSGKHIFIACDSTATPLASADAAARAIALIYQYRDYHLLQNNCHQFVWQCFVDGDQQLTTFNALNKRLASYFNRRVYWDLIDFS